MSDHIDGADRWRAAGERLAAASPLIFEQLLGIAETIARSIATTNPEPEAADPVERRVAESLARLRDPSARKKPRGARRGAP